MLSAPNRETTLGASGRSPVVVYVSFWPLANATPFYTGPYSLDLTWDAHSVNSGTNRMVFYKHQGAPCEQTVSAATWVPIEVGYIIINQYDGHSHSRPSRIMIDWTGDHPLRKTHLFDRRGAAHVRLHGEPLLASHQSASMRTRLILRYISRNPYLGRIISPLLKPSTIPATP